MGIRPEHSTPPCLLTLAHKIKTILHGIFSEHVRWLQPITANAPGAVSTCSTTSRLKKCPFGGLLRYQLPRVTDFLAKYQSPHCQPGPNLLSKLFFFLTRICTVTGIHFFHKNELHSNQPEGLMRSWPIFPGFLLFQFWKKSALIFNSMCLGPSSQLGVNAFLQTRSALMTTFSSPGEN